jgi:hypothetical protein
MQLTFADFWLPLFCCLLLSHIAAQGVAILLRPWVLRRPNTKQVAEAVRQARAEVEQTIWGDEPRLRRQAGYMSGVRSSRRRREEES